ncbi:MAG: outer membrane protein assembly factor [Bacillota bacterium]
MKHTLLGIRVIASAIAIFVAAFAGAQTTRPVGAIAAELAGRTVEEVRIIGRNQPLSSTATSEIAHRIRTREGDALDPATVETDYHHIYDSHKFTNVEARVEPTETGVIVIFEVTEAKLISEIRFTGNERIDTTTLKSGINLKPGEAMDAYRLSTAQDIIHRLYMEKNRPHVHVLIDRDEAAKSGVVTFQIIEGPRVRVRKIRVLGNRTYADGTVEKQAKTRSWFPLFVAGKFDPDQLEQDVAAIRKFYEERGFFDVQVGRKVTVGPDQEEVMISFLVEEGPRYVVERIRFKGNNSLPEAKLREEMKMEEGQYYDQERIRRDTRAIVRAYSPLGRIYMPQETDPDYLTIKDEHYFSRASGKVELVYNISEGKPFRIGQIIVKGNGKTQDKVVLRELRVTPGQLYDAEELRKAVDRLKATSLFSNIIITPIKSAESPATQPAQ